MRVKVFLATTECSNIILLIYNFNLYYVIINIKISNQKVIKLFVIFLFMLYSEFLFLLSHFITVSLISYIKKYFFRFTKFIIF